MVRKLLAVLFALALVGATAGVAQVGIGVSGQYLSLSGDDFSGTDAGFGVEGNVLFPVGPSLRVGPSAQWSTHQVSGFTDNGTIFGLLGEARYMLGGAGKATPYIAARAGWAQASISESGTTAKQSGVAFGGGVGVMIAMSPGLGIDLNGVFHSVSLGDLSVDGTSIADTNVSGTALQIRAGINFKLGGGM